MPKPRLKTARALTVPEGIGRSGRCSASNPRSNASFKYMPPT
jgi:hypothetical protein